MAIIIHLLLTKYLVQKALKLFIHFLASIRSTCYFVDFLNVTVILFFMHCHIKGTAYKKLKDLWITPKYLLNGTYLLNRDAVKFDTTAMTRLF